MFCIKRFNVFASCSYDKHLAIKMVNDDAVETFHINVLNTNRTDHINLSYLQKQTGDKFNSHYVLLFDDALDPTLNEIVDDANDWMRPIFDTFWENHLFNVLIVYFDNSDQQLRVFSFNPFGNEDYLLDLSDRDVKYSQLFWDKASNLNKNTFRVSLFAEKTRAIFHKGGRMSGTDGLLTELMIERMNATLRLKPPTDGFDIGEFLPNGSFTGSLAQILNEEVDISFNTRFLRLKQFYGRAQITFTNGRDDICFLVAKAGYASNVYNIFRAFSLPVWLMVLASLFIASFSFTILYKMQPESRPLQHTFFNFYSWNLAQPILRLPDNWATKILIAFWVIYALLITSSYEGNLTSNLVLRPTLADINTIKQLHDSKLEILTFGRYVDLLVIFFNQSKAYSGLEKRIRSVSSAKELEKHIHEKEMQYAYANKQHINQYLSRRKENSRYGRPMFHNVRECPVPFLVAYALRIGSPYLARINSILRRAQENGMIAYWDTQSEETTSRSSSQVGGGGGPVSLTLDHMQSAFYILGFGMVFAMLTLAAEIVYTRRLKSKQVGCFRI